MEYRKLTLLLLLLLVTMSFSCKGKNGSTNLFDQVENLAQANMPKALVLLSPANNPESTALERQPASGNHILYLCICLFIILVVATIGYLVNRKTHYKYEKEQEKNKLLKAECELLAKTNENILHLQKISRNILTDWGTIDRKVRTVTSEYGLKKKPTIYTSIERMMDNLRLDANLQFIEWAKEYMRIQPNGKKAVKLLNEKELLLLMLCYCKYPTRDVAFTLRIGSASLNIYLRKLDLMHKLNDAGVPESITKQMIFPE